MKPSLIIILAYCIFSAVILILFNGTGGEADSINHYLHAKFAFQHPSLFLNHWAKPFFTLLVSPFAQFGFIGAKFFNVLCSLITTYFTYKIAQTFNFKNAYLAPLFLFLFPLSFITTYSGLTEPLSAAMLTLAIYFTLNNKHWQAAIILSFLPFVRSEGLLFIAVFASYWAIKKQWKVIPFLLTGHLLYSVIGSFHYSDLLWVFTKIPYATLNSHYGSGNIFQFAEQLIYITGVPLLIFFLAGSIRSVFHYKSEKNGEFFILIVCNFLLFFIAHSLFWYLGIFNSMGLKRVFATVTPLMAIIALFGFDLLSKIRPKNVKTALTVLIMGYVLIFPFTPNPAAIDWRKDMNLTQAQMTAIEVSTYIQNSTFKGSRFIYTDPYLGETLKIDPFDFEERLTLSKEALVHAEKGDLIIWDNWHAVVDYRVALKDLKQFREVKQFENGQSKYVLFIVE